VAELERHLGARLLHRSTRRIALTSIGESYLARARTILHELDEATALARQSQAEPRGVLRVMTPPSFAAQQVVRRLPPFHAVHPKITVEITAWPVEAPDDEHDITIVVSLSPLDGDFVARGSPARKCWRARRLLPGAARLAAAPAATGRAPHAAAAHAAARRQCHVRARRR
jgi:DNA-binding transcriptional LysR family regulator